MLFRSGGRSGGAERRLDQSTDGIPHLLPASTCLPRCLNLGGLCAARLADGPALLRIERLRAAANWGIVSVFRARGARSCSFRRLSDQSRSLESVGAEFRSEVPPTATKSGSNSSSTFASRGPSRATVGAATLSSDERASLFSQMISIRRAANRSASSDKPGELGRSLVAFCTPRRALASRSALKRAHSADQLACATR